MPYLDSNGTEIHIQQLNPDCDETIILLHGLLIGSLAMWYFTAAPVLAKKYRVIMYDMRSHGKSERVDTGFDVPSMVGDLQSVVNHYNLKKFSLAGHSYGGLVALNYALNNPEAVEKLCIIEAPLPPSDMKEMNLFADKSPDDMVKALPGWMQALVCSGKRQAVRLLQSLEYLTFKTTLFSDLEKEEDIADSKLNSLKPPALLLYGDNSSCRPAGLRMAKNISDSKFVSLPGGHYLPMECTNDVNNQLTEFFCGEN